jgi:hypothetical protein
LGIVVSKLGEQFFIACLHGYTGQAAEQAGGYDALIEAGMRAGIMHRLSGLVILIRLVVACVQVWDHNDRAKNEDT